MTPITVLEKAIDTKEPLITELRNDHEFIAELRRGLEARCKGKMVSWDEIKSKFARLT